jgi:3-hydroxyisobutyrate dehydrogenase-like beta-hydroxyacid dehydrogenase
MARTRIGIIGAGNMGSAFAQRPAAAGGSVRAVPRDQKRAPWSRWAC